MKNFKFLTIGILPLMWLIYFLFELITGRLTNAVDIAFNLLLIIPFGLVGLLIYYLAKKYDTGFSAKVLIYIFLTLMLLDQGVKVIIKLFFFDKFFYVIPNLLSFNPIINDQGSWLNARFGAGVSFNLLIILNIIALFLFLEIYRYITKKLKIKDFYIDMSYLFMTSGALCSLIDKVFYGGSLDFIGISDLFIADFKDIFINLGIFLLILALFKHDSLEDDETSNELNEIKDFFKFIKYDTKSFFQKNKN